MEQNSQRIRTFSINLPFPLYEKLLNKAGKGRVSTFIKKLVEKDLSGEEEELAQAYKECYTNNPRLLEEAKLWERAGIETWLNYERGLYHKKSTKKVSKSTSKKASRNRWQ